MRCFSDRLEFRLCLLIRQIFYSSAVIMVKRRWIIHSEALVLINALDSSSKPQYRNTGAGYYDNRRIKLHFGRFKLHFEAVIVKPGDSNFISTPILWNRAIRTSFRGQFYETWRFKLHFEAVIVKPGNSNFISRPILWNRAIQTSFRRQFYETGRFKLHFEANFMKSGDSNFISTP
jgi:hypothetical protein